jgi:hypothetical protein
MTPYRATSEDQIAEQILLWCSVIEEAAEHLPKVKDAGVFAIALSQAAVPYKIKRILEPLRDEVRKIKALRRMEEKQ